MGLLALVAGEDVKLADEPSRWRFASGVVRNRAVSVVDPESRHVHKTAHGYRDGFKSHISVKPDTGLVVAADLTAGTSGDADAVTDPLAGEPVEVPVYADSVSGTGQLCCDLHEAVMTAVIKPSPRVAAEGGYSIDDFDIGCCVSPDSDEFFGTVTCPEGTAVNITPKSHACSGASCRRCPQRSPCATAKAASTVTPRPHQDCLATTRAEGRTPQFVHDYRRWRPVAKRAIAWIVCRNRKRPHI